MVCPFRVMRTILFTINGLGWLVYLLLLARLVEKYGTSDFGRILHRRRSPNHLESISRVSRSLGLMPHPRQHGPHLLPSAPGWEQVADDALEWAVAQAAAWLANRKTPVQA